MNNAQAQSPVDAPRSDDLAAIDGFRGVLTRCDFTIEAITEHIGPQAVAALSRDQAAPALRALQGHRQAGTWSGLSTLITLFILARPVDEQLFRHSVSQEALPQWVALGLVERVGGTVRSTVDIDVHSADNGLELWVASDLTAFQRPGAALRHDYVLGVGGASLTLAQITERKPVKRAVDIGTGCGIQIFHLLAHAQHVVATDISARALAFARFNLLLNAPALGLDPQRLSERVDLRRGSLLEPVAGEQFDVVVTNPPFVITPRTGADDHTQRYTYRDGGRSGDLLVADLLHHVDQIMAPGGTAHMLANWEIEQAQDQQQWFKRVESWLPPTLDAWVIQREEQTPEQYAETWLRDASEHLDRGAYEASYLAYLDDFAQRDVRSVGFGYLRLEKPSHCRQVRRRWECLTHPVQQPIAPVTAEAVHRWEVVDALGSQWLDLHMEVASDVTEERHMRPGAEDPSVIVLRQGAGLQRSVVLTSAAAGLVDACDGQLSVREIVLALGQLLGWSEPVEQSPEALEVINQTRYLVIDGFLSPK